MCNITDVEINVLCIEDSEVDFRFFKQVLKKNHQKTFKLTHRTHFQGALNMLTAQHFDIVVLDLSFSSLHCLESLKIIQRTCPHIPVVILTSKNDTPTIKEALHIGAQDYLIKGEYNEKSVYRALTYAIEREHKMQLLKNELQQKEQGEPYEPSIFQRKENCNIRSLMHSIIAFVSEQIQTDDIIFSLNVSSEVSDSYVLEETRLYQLLVLCIANAVKHTDTGEITIQISQIAKDISGNVTLGFTIIDTGKGMDSETHSRVVRFIEGVSMAIPCKDLAICKQHISAMGGKIENFDSVEGNGTTIGFVVKAEEQAQLRA